MKVALLFGFVLSVALGAASAKDLDEVRKVYLAPVISEEDLPVFQAMVKSELVHEGFVVPPKQEEADATLTIELILTKKGEGFQVEAHAKLEEGDFNVLWTGSITKSDKDKDKLIINAARAIVGKLKSAKLDVIAKKDEKNKDKQPR